VVARMPARQGRGRARHRSARAASPQLRRHGHHRRPSVLGEEPVGVLPTGRAVLGAARRRPRTV
jgi:hypothetical protein